MKVNTYLNFGGNCEAAFRYYEKNLGGKIGMLMTHDQMPGGGEPRHDLKGKVLHASLQLGGATIMGSDVPSDRFQPVRSSYLSLSADSTEDAERIFAVLSDGGEVPMPLAETFFAHRFGIARDRFGVLWMVLHERPMNA